MGRLDLESAFTRSLPFVSGSRADELGSRTPRPKSPRKRRRLFLEHRESLYHACRCEQNPTLCASLTGSAKYIFDNSYIPEATLCIVHRFQGAR